MAFHHVLLSLDPEPNKLRSVFVDLSENELKTKFVTPYRKGRSFVSDNEIIVLTGIRKVHIIRTDQKNETERSALHDRSLREIDEFNRNSSIRLISLGRGYDPEDILEVGQDVTSTFINGPPGYAATPTLTSSVINHPWLVGIGTAVIATAIATWFKLS